MREIIYIYLFVGLCVAIAFMSVIYGRGRIRLFGRVVFGWQRKFAAILLFIFTLVLWPVVILQNTIFKA